MMAWEKKGERPCHHFWKIYARFTGHMRRMQRERVWKNFWNLTIRTNTGRQAVRQMR